MKKRNTTTRIVLIAMMACISYVLSTFVYFPRMAPFQHMMNVLTACLLGPLDAFATAALTGLMRMILGGRTIQALIGAVIGAPLAGILYKRFKKPLFAFVGEVFGTGILSALLVYPFMVQFYGLPAETPFWTFIPSYVPSSICGAAIGIIIMGILQKAGVWQKMKEAINN
ncbi:MAG: energy coupling factor transporter S component ThiW [Clostridiales bacterium]|nr:energy coupling factor transporter S component ThiW [Clostridiales bacterium]